MYKRSLFWWTLLSFISGYCYRANAQSVRGTERSV